MAEEGVQGVVMVPGAIINSARKQLAILAAKARLPVVYPEKRFVVAGGLASYGGDVRHVMRRAADYVSMILKGAYPATLPVDQLDRWEVVVNTKTAKALGINFTPSVLLRASEVIN